MSGRKIIQGLREAIRHARGLRCYGCGRLYEKGPDLVVSDADWDRIRPPDGKPQVLCPNCMNDAFEAIGAPYASVEAAFTSGPFAQPRWKKP